ncbi:mechanosensitive ion channel [Shimia sp. CNT1-13L.2]|uniref:mechanosensitive ion channel family protein n=1 Tax=Shimia sp. CNT1-13L.2 TaxID=2959663 RepID=UPI0020CC6A88|nr:mechanosensitive ion channel domain-containing protein [Shimia sp. CNT1-13L.2]MCP9482382.1 mechanosensitive ion channel [Shimia sp. CNT1-13L.2]
MADEETTQAESQTTLEQATDAPAEAVEQDAQEIALSVWDQTLTFLEGLLRPWNAYQVAIALAVLAVSLLLARIIKPRFYEWMRAREDWPKWRYRYMLMLHRRLALVVFVVLIWSIVWIMREVTWPSRSYLLGVLANLSTAWLVVVLVVRLVSNSFLRAILRYGAWAWVTISILGLSQETMQLMDHAAIEIGETRISLWVVAQAAVMLGLTFALARFLSTQSATSIRNNEDISPSMQVLFVKFLQVVLYGIAFVVGLRIVGFDLRGLAFMSGFIGVGLGFGLQKVVSNLVSGIIILLDKSIKPGDVISLGETFGWINSLGARYVSVVTRDGREYLIPNEDLITGQVVNWSHTDAYVRLDIYFGTSYGDDPHVVRKLAIDAAKSVDRVLTFPKTPVCHIVGFGDSSVDYILRFWIEDPTGGLTNIRGNVYLALWDAFHENGISLPFPQREVRMLQDGDPRPLAD